MMILPKTVSTYLAELHTQARRLPPQERADFVADIEDRVASLAEGGASPAQIRQGLAAIGAPGELVNDLLAQSGVDLTSRYVARSVRRALICAWVGMAAGLAFNPWLPFGLLRIALILPPLLSAAWIALLVFSIQGKMWRRWIDGASALALLLVVPMSPALVLGALSTPADDSGACVRTPGPSLCSQGGPSPTVSRAVLALALILVAAVTAHWIARLKADDATRAQAPLTNRAKAGWALAAVLGCLGAVALIVMPVVTTPALRASVVNDTGHDVSIAICPEQNCSGQSSTRLADGDTTSVPLGRSNIPDSVVVTDPGGGHRCALLPVEGDTVSADEYLDGQTVISLASVPDVLTCSTDVSSLRG